MTAVKERRALRTKTAVKTYSTGTGIFLLFVADGCVHPIPRDFTWAELNESKKAFPWGRGVRVPTLERSKGEKSRASC